MALHPKALADLALAPVAAGIDLNLQELRDKPPRDVDAELQLLLDRPPIPDDPPHRAGHVLEAATRNIDLHGWATKITDDSSRLHLSGGSVTLDIGLGDTVRQYIENGA